MSITERAGRTAISREGRSRIMQAIRAKDTQPELLVRRLAHKLGYRYRLHHPGLPGKPDLVFAWRRKVIFVHGCFWHQHPNGACTNARLPRSNLAYWQPKLARNTERDARNLAALAAAGWQAMVIWECETTDQDQLVERLWRFVG